MTQPAFGVICDICMESSGDWRAIGELWICGTCWDPFGTLIDRVAVLGVAVLGISPSQGKIEPQQNGPEAVRQHRRSPGPRHLLRTDWSSDQ